MGREGLDYKYTSYNPTNHNPPHSHIHPNVNYVAKAKGIKRSMTCYEALVLCPELILIHVSTFEVLDARIAEQIGATSETKLAPKK